MLIDAHCHLEADTYGDTVPEVMARAKAAGLVGFIAVGASGVAAGAAEVLRLSEAHACVYAAVGIHPHEAQGAEAEPAAMQTIATALAHPKVVALGEVGLDYYYESSPKAVQQAVLRRFVQMAHQHDKPLMLHIRDAHADCITILDEEGLPPRGGVVHCFTAGVSEAKAYLDRGMLLSIAGVVTFKNAAPLREAVQYAPHDRLMVETDCPYLAPVPYRGKRNEPAFMVKTVATMAELRGCSYSDVASQTTANACRFFGLPAQLVGASGSD